MYEIKKTTQDMSEQFNKDMENLRKKESNRNPGYKNSLNQNQPTNQTNKQKNTPGDIPKSAYNKITCTPMLIVALFTISKLWN
jgi:hypothetical protein